jgi:hypothetical protein
MGVAAGGVGVPMVVRVIVVRVARMAMIGHEAAVLPCRLS